MTRFSARPAALFPIFLALIAAPCLGNAAVRGAFYRLGDDDPAAAPGQLGNDPTLDSFSDHLDLSRFGSPRYSSDVPPLSIDSKLSMQFGTTGGPAVPGFYGRDTSATMIEQGYAIEAWVKAANPAVVGPVSNSLIAYNGTPGSNGFGLYQVGSDYVARIGSFDRTLGPADASAWHHLAYVYSLGNEAYFFDGKLVFDTTTDPAALAAKGGLWIGGQGTALDPLDLFTGSIDEVRYQSFNPIAASGDGGFDPLLIAAVPEPLCALPCLALLLVLRRRRPKLSNPI